MRIKAPDSISWRCEKCGKDTVVRLWDLRRHPVGRVVCGGLIRVANAESGMRSMVCDEWVSNAQLMRAIEEGHREWPVVEVEGSEV